MSTGTADRDAHLRGEDFFDVENFPELTFVSTAFDGDTLTGDLTIKGVTKPVTLDVEFNGVATDPWGNDKAAFEATGELNRSDWGLTWNASLEKGGVLVSEKSSSSSTSSSPSRPASTTTTGPSAAAATAGSSLAPGRRQPRPGLGGGLRTLSAARSRRPRRRAPR